MPSWKSQLEHKLEAGLHSCALLVWFLGQWSKASCAAGCKGGTMKAMERGLQKFFARGKENLVRRKPESSLEGMNLKVIF